MPRNADLPPGVNWEDSPLFDFALRPRLSLFPDLARLLIVGWMALKYAEVTDRQFKEANLLDVACGFGELYRIVKSQRLAKGSRLTYMGIDIDHRKHERAKELMPRIDFRLGRVQDLRALVAPERFDVVVSTETLEDIPKADGERFLVDCMSVLKGGGTFILTTANPKIRRDHPWHMYEWPEDELFSFVEQQGWEVADSFYLKSPVRSIPGSGMAPRRVPNEMIRGVMSPLADTGSVTVLVLRDT